MFEYDQQLQIALLNAFGSRQAIYGIMEDGFDIILLQEIPWTPWKVRTKDMDPHPLENITVYDKCYEIFHAPLAVPYKI